VTPNVAAFLSTICHSEGTDRAPDPYRCCYAFKHTIVDMSDHPAVTGEWRGEPLDSLGPRYAGMVSTAAGRYQLIKATWLRCKQVLALSDFSSHCQDDAAILLIKEAGALGLVNAGMIGDAITKCSGIWASLPGSDAGQPTRTFAQLLQTYASAGGTYV
jgi:lysozyme